MSNNLDSNRTQHFLGVLKDFREGLNNEEKLLSIWVEIHQGSSSTIFVFVFQMKSYPIRDKRN